MQTEFLLTKISETSCVVSIHHDSYLKEVKLEWWNEGKRVVVSFNEQDIDLVMQKDTDVGRGPIH